MPGGSALVALNLATCVFQAAWSTGIQPSFAATGFVVAGLAFVVAGAALLVAGAPGGAERTGSVLVAGGGGAGDALGRLAHPAAAPAIRRTATAAARAERRGSWNADDDTTEG
ncbi:hypothetical protein GCM10023107_85630 [Actinoplanes octamycinicus]|nr:hypothetical protein Aoc01nite_72030 [Actinoplanes octamycinicus]